MANAAGTLLDLVAQASRAACGRAMCTEHVLCLLLVRWLYERMHDVDGGVSAGLPDPRWCSSRTCGPCSSRCSEPTSPSSTPTLTKKVGRLLLPPPLPLHHHPTTPLSSSTTDPCHPPLLPLPPAPACLPLSSAQSPSHSTSPSTASTPTTTAASPGYAGTAWNAVVLGSVQHGPPTGDASEAAGSKGHSCPDCLPLSRLTRPTFFPTADGLAGHGCSLRTWWTRGGASRRTSSRSSW